MPSLVDGSIRYTVGIFGGPAAVLRLDPATELSEICNVPALAFEIGGYLAVAEPERGSARDPTLAIVIAYEIGRLLVNAFDITTRGWDPPACVSRQLRSPPAN